MQHFIGCDVHTRNQVVAWIEEETGEIRKRRLEHEGEEVKEFYAQFPRGTVVGIEATFPAYWFERLLGELGHELWVGDAARIRASEVRYQKTDARDAEHILDLLRTGRFPRIWVPSLGERDLRQLLVHRMKQVRARTQVSNTGTGGGQSNVLLPIRPRMEGGETSATYMGERIDAPPTASPPAKRARMKSVKLDAVAVATEVRAKNSATHSRILRRPYLSVKRPAANAPTTHPNSNELKAQPRLRSLR